MSILDPVGLSMRQFLANQPYKGAIATRCLPATSTVTSIVQGMSRSYHVAQDDITSLQLVYQNWFGSDLTLPTALTTITASIEYPVGYFTQVKFSGNASGTIPLGLNLTSDVIDIQIPRNAVFYCRQYTLNSGGVCYRSFTKNQNLGEACILAATGVTDQTMSGTVTGNSAGSGNMFAPVALIGPTRRPTIMVLGDSRVHGQGDTFPIPGTTNTETGMIAPSLFPSIGYINSGVAGDSAANVAGVNGVRRTNLGVYATHIICQLGVNDLTADTATVATTVANLKIIQARFNGKPFYVTTLPPRSLSTDGWATTVNQSQDPRQVGIRAFNQRIRTNSDGFTGYFEYADLYETARDSGIWKAPGITADGIHPTHVGYVQALTAGIVTPSMFTR